MPGQTDNMERRTNTMNQIDPTKLKKVVIPHTETTQKVTVNPELLNARGLGSLPKPTDNPPPSPQTIQAKQPTPPLPDTHPAKSPLPDTHPTPQPIEVIKNNEQVPQEQNVTENSGKDPVTGRFVEGNKASLGRKNKYSLDALLEAELQKPHGRLPDGTMVTKGEMINRKLIEKAVDGNMKAIEIVTNRTDGKPMQKIQVVAPEDAEGTVMNDEAEAKVMSLFGRKKD